MVLLTGLSQLALANEAPLPKLTLISNVNIFDGKTDRLHQGMQVLIKDNLIETTSDEPLAVLQTDNVTMLDVGGRTLIPGLIDAHWHTSYGQRPTPPSWMTANDPLLPLRPRT